MGRHESGTRRRSITTLKGIVHKPAHAVSVEDMNAAIAKQGAAMTVLHLDCEFTDFLDIDLISIALAADDGREFYGERSDYNEAACSAFVREAVLPQLGQQPERVFTREGLREALLGWLDREFASEHERVICVDYAGDRDLLIDLLEELPPGWVIALVSVDQGKLETYFAQHPGRHHALVDARAQRYAMLGASIGISDARR